LEVPSKKAPSPKKEFYFLTWNLGLKTLGLPKIKSNLELGA
jgi:hypothetical protein